MSEEALLEVDGLTRSFRVGQRRLVAVRDVSLTLKSGESLGLVGESGSGKSTLARCVMGLLRPDTGAVRFGGRDLTRLARRGMRDIWRELQIVFQDPGSALNSRMTVGQNILDPLAARGIGTRAERERRLGQLLSDVGLDSRLTGAYVFELSGGQQQRVMIARALAAGPRLVVCDEPVSSLDLSVQAQILALLRDLKSRRRLSYLFISHNLPAVGQVSDHVAVMYLGRIVETAPVEQIFCAPRHPYTSALIDSILPVPKSRAERKPLRALPGEIPSPLRPPSGCSFHTRCPLVQERCRTAEPDLRVVGERHTVACHLA